MSDLKALVAQGEGLHVEFKRKANFPEKIVKEAVAFANTGGGMLLIGVDDSGLIAGLPNPDEDLYIMEHALATYIQPSMAYTLQQVVVNAQGHAVLAYHIPSQPQGQPFAVVHQGSRTVYVRVNDRSIQASKELRQVMRLAQQGRKLRFEFGIKEKMLMDHLDQHGSITLPQFAELAGISLHLASRTLVLLASCRVISILPHEKGDRYVLRAQA